MIIWSHRGYMGYRGVRSSFRWPTMLNRPIRVFKMNSGWLNVSTIRGYTIIPKQEEVLLKFKFPVSTHTITQISQEIDKYLDTDAIITLNGHLNRKPRIMAKNIFAELRDHNNDLVQLLLSPDYTDDELFNILQSSIPEEAISVSGKVKAKQSRTGNKEWELLVTNYQVLNESNLDAARLDKLKHSSPKDLPPQFRYLQLRDKYYQNALKLRSQISHLIRKVFIENHDFVELETPLLFKSTPEGAREFLVPTRTSGAFYALPQSPQQYKQILMSSGFTRYFQIAKCFRDEDLRSDRQPEFTQVDLEMSFISHSDQVAIVVEDIIFSIWSRILNNQLYTINENGNLQPVTELVKGQSTLYKIPYIRALSEFGIDKPDMRSNLSFINLSKFLIPTKNSNFPVLEACVLKQALTIKGGKKVPKSLTNGNNYSKRKPIIIPINSQSDAEFWYEKFVEKNVITKTDEFNHDELKELLNIEVGDILAFSDRADLPYENPTPLGKFRQLAINEYPGYWQRKIEIDGTEMDPTCHDSPIFVATWVNEFPLFNPTEISNISSNEEGTSDYPLYDCETLESTHHPFTMVKPEDYSLLQQNPLKAKGEHYDLVINGVEVGGGSRRIHDPKLQKYIFQHVLNIDNHMELFGHLLNALSMGCPPHAGLALGFDRLCAMIIGSNSIRDVIAFPKNQSGVDPVVESPSVVPDTTLNEYYITTKK